MPETQAAAGSRRPGTCKATLLRDQHSYLCLTRRHSSSSRTIPTRTDATACTGSRAGALHIVTRDFGSYEVFVPQFSIIQHRTVLITVHNTVQTHKQQISLRTSFAFCPCFSCARLFACNSSRGQSSGQLLRTFLLRCKRSPNDAIQVQPNEACHNMRDLVAQLTSCWSGKAINLSGKVIFAPTESSVGAESWRQCHFWPQVKSAESLEGDVLGPLPPENAPEARIVVLSAQYGTRIEGGSTSFTSGSIELGKHGVLVLNQSCHGVRIEDLNFHGMALFAYPFTSSEAMSLCCSVFTFENS